jgi:regulator of sigma E protease
LPAALTDEFEPSDLIVALDGNKITNSRQLREYLTLNADKSIAITVERSKEEGEDPTTVNIEVAPNPMRRLGLAMKTGAISAIQKESPAFGKLEAGDLMLTIDGQPVGNLINAAPSSISEEGPLPNPILLSLYLQRKARAQEEVTVRVMRTTGKQKEEFKDIKVTPRLPITSPNYGGMGHPISIDELGVALPILNWVVAIEPGSAAEKELQPGDKITKVEFILDDEWKDSEELASLRNLEAPIDLVEGPTDWPRVHTKLQMLPPNTKIKISYTRDGQQKTAELAPTTSGSWGSWYNPTRGFFLEPKEEIRKAEGIGEAFALGVAQTGEDATRVFRFLRKLVSGGISPTNLGGPGTIVFAATSEASVSLSRLLLFFTLLSANLAIVNFLPIPVLDGGHMVFLIYELIFRKPPNEKIFMGLTLVGFAFIVSLMLFVIGLDVFRFANWF